MGEPSGEVLTYTLPSSVQTLSSVPSRLRLLAAPTRGCPGVRVNEGIAIVVSLFRSHCFISFLL